MVITCLLCLEFCLLVLVSHKICNLIFTLCCCICILCGSVWPTDIQGVHFFLLKIYLISCVCMYKQFMLSFTKAGEEMLCRWVLLPAPLELEWHWVTVWALGTAPESSAKGSSALNCQAFSPAFEVCSCKENYNFACRVMLQGTFHKKWWMYKCGSFSVLSSSFDFPLNVPLCCECSSFEEVWNTGAYFCGICLISNCTVEIPTVFMLVWAVSYYVSFYIKIYMWFVRSIWVAQ